MNRRHARYHHNIRVSDSFGLADILAMSPFQLYIAKADGYATAGSGLDTDVAQWTDLSGNSKHVTAGSSAAYPDYVENFLGSNQSALVFNGTDNRLANTTQISGFSTAISCCVIWRASMENNSANQTFFEYTLNANINSGLQCYVSAAGAVYYRLFSNGGNQAVILTGQSFPYEGVFAIDINSTTGKLIAYKDKVKLGEASVVGTWTNAVNRLYMGSPNTGQDFKGKYGAFAAFTASKAEAEIFNICDYFTGGYANIALPPFVVFEGNSLGNDPASGGYDPSYQSILMTNNPLWESANKHLNGDTMQNMAANYTSITSVYRPRASRNVLILLAGTNDIGSAARTGAQVYADMQTLITQCVSTGFECFVCTIPDRSPDTYDTEIGNYNTLLRTNAGSNYTIIDLAADPVFSDGSDTDYFYDGLHFTVAAHARAAELIQAVVFT